MEKAEPEVGMFGEIVTLFHLCDDKLRSTIKLQGTCYGLRTSVRWQA